MSVFIPIPKKGSAKECSNYHTAALILHASIVMLNFLQVRLQQSMNQEVPDFQAGYRKGRGTTDQIANICWIIKKQENSRKTSTSASLTMLKLLTVWVTTNCGKFLSRWEHETTLSSSCKTLSWSRSNSQNRTWITGLIPNWERSMSRLHIATLLI